MKILVDLPEGLVLRVRSLIDAGSYSGTASFIRAAVENQLEWESGEAGPREALADTRLLEQFRKSTSSDGPKDPGAGGASRSEKVELWANYIVRQETEPSLPHGAGKWLGVANSHLAEPFEPEAPLPVLNPTGMLWGQVNRFFPGKVGLRALASFVDEDDPSVELPVYLEGAAWEAVKLAGLLRSEDRALRRRRDQAMSTGLPMPNSNPDREQKSRNRFQQQFLVRLRQDGQADGALARLQLVTLGVGNDGEPVVGFSRAGLEFCRLSNPILDHGMFSSTLFESEIEFLLEHILEQLPGEAEAMALLLRLLECGTTNRTALNGALAAEWPSSWSAKHVNTQRSGLTARLVELDLLEKSRDGVAVTYSPAPAGIAFLRRVESQFASLKVAK